MNTLREIKDRANAPTPPFFQKLKRIGLVMAAVATAVMTAPVSLPVILTTAVGYLVTAVTVMVAVSQMTVEVIPPGVQIYE